MVRIAVCFLSAAAKLLNSVGLHLLRVSFTKARRLRPVDVGGCELGRRVVHEQGILIEERPPRLGFSGCQCYQGEEQYPCTAQKK